MKSKLLYERTNCFFATKNVIQFAKRAAKLILTLNFKVKKIFFLLHCILFIRKLELFRGNILKNGKKVSYSVSRAF